MNSKILNTCQCLNENNWTNEICCKPSTYIAFMLFWNSVYKFHFKNEHSEKFISKEIVLGFLSKNIDFLYFFRRQIKKINQIVRIPLEKTEILNVSIFECSKTIESISSTDQMIDISVLINVIELTERTLALWGSYTYNNKIDIFY